MGNAEMERLWMQLLTLFRNESFIIGVLSSITVMLAAFACKKLLLAWEYRSDATGWWYSEIIENSKVVKSDWYKIYHNKRTGVIKGHMTRFWPVEQDGREWEVSGRLNNTTLIMFSYSHKLETSTATTLARLKEPRIFVGEYLRYNENTNVIDCVEIHYNKVPNRIKGKKSFKKYQQKLIADFSKPTIS